VTTRVLVIGAGAVGQVFGYHLQRAGAAVTFFVRDKHKERVQRGFDLYALSMLRGRRARVEPVHFERFEVITSLADIAAGRFEQVYLALPSNAVRDPWMKELAAALGSSDPNAATIISIQPMADDREAILAAGVPEARLVSGLISFLAYAAPLEGETRFAASGLAYWLPPLTAAPFSGPDARTRAVVRLLNQGGLHARRHPDVPRTVGFPTAIGMAYITALEAAGWSLRAFRTGPELSLGARAAREASAIVARTTGKAFLSTQLTAALAFYPALIRLVLWFAERIVPLPLEAYVRAHFTKVREQTRLILSSLITAGHTANLPVHELEVLTEETAKSLERTAHQETSM